MRAPPESLMPIDRRAVLQRHIHHFTDLVRHDAAQAAAENGKVLRIDVDQTAIDGAVAGHHRIAEKFLLIHAEIGAVVRCASDPARRSCRCRGECRGARAPTSFPCSCWRRARSAPPPASALWLSSRSLSKLLIVIMKKDSLEAKSKSYSASESRHHNKSLSVSTEFRRERLNASKLRCADASVTIRSRRSNANFHERKQLMFETKNNRSKNENRCHARAEHAQTAQRSGDLARRRQRRRRQHALRGRLFRARSVYFFSAQENQVRRHERPGNRPRQKTGPCRSGSVAFALSDEAAQARQDAGGA